jgi:hypothetical protein
MVLAQTATQRRYLVPKVWISMLVAVLIRSAARSPVIMLGAKLTETNQPRAPTRLLWLSWFLYFNPASPPRGL